MAQATEAQQRYGATQRTDRWWLEPALVGIGLFLFVVYSSISGFAGDNFDWHFEAGPYLSPFFEPLIRPGWLPSWISPAVFILWAPLGFRLTCYYYRRAYYRSYFMSPPACMVREPAGSYSGESRFPLILQNAHRFFLYVALLFVPVLWYGAIKSFWLPGEGLGFGLGTLILSANAFLLMMYTFGCHSLRHLVGGQLDCFSCTNFTRTRRKAWDLVTVANEKHRMWAWFSLVSVGVSDLYVRLVANGVVTDLNTWTNF
ncbi:MAG: succinate dehydrogenase [Dehalococcoidia bacterium]